MQTLKKKELAIFIEIYGKIMIKIILCIVLSQISGAFMLDVSIISRVELVLIN